LVCVELADTLVILENLQKKKTQGSTKIKVQLVTYSELKEAFEAEEKEQIEKEHVEAKKEIQKVADANARNSHIVAELVLKIFDAPLSTYKWKEELEIFTTVLVLSPQGTVAKLTQ
ncbi:hypothetical protein C0991_010270, partial [Blastosporella zonata]